MESIKYLFREIYKLYKQDEYFRSNVNRTIIVVCMFALGGYFIYPLVNDFYSVTPEINNAELKTAQINNTELKIADFKENEIIIDNENIYKDPVEVDSLKLISQGYYPKYIRNGEEPDCFNYFPKYDNLDNKLVVEVGGGTDIAIKLMDINSGSCIRYFFINSGSTYTIKNIPQGVYYLKIAYGKGWMMTREGGNCKGKFLRSPLYEKGSETLDFYLKDYGDHYQIPSYQLRLDIISTSMMNSFKSDNISEIEFNK